MVFFGQIIVGPPGSGKTTYCHGMKQFLDELGRSCDIINLDFANDLVPYETAIDVRDLVDLDAVMEELDLGPNGGLVYCMEYLLENIDWLVDRIEELEGHYIIFDCPGQIELYTHQKSVQNIVQKLQVCLDARLCSVHLVDSYYCSQPHVFISAALHCASTMLRLGLPHVNVLSKVDLLTQYGDLPFNLDFFTEMSNLQPLLKFIHEGSIPTDVHDEDLNNDYDEEGATTKRPVATAPMGGDKMKAKFYDLTAGLCEVLEDFGMISFTALNIEDAQTVGRVLVQVDKANGYCFAASEIEEGLQRQKTQSAGAGAGAGAAGGTPTHPLFRMASQDLEPSYHKTMEIQERYANAEVSPLMPVAGGIISSGKRVMAERREQHKQEEADL